MSIKELISRIKSIPRVTFIHSIVILLLSALVDALWFRRGLVIGYAEPGIFTYNNIRWISISSHLWIDQISTGSYMTMVTAGLPMHLFLGFLESLGFSPLHKEVIFFYLLLSLSGLSMYYLIFVAFRQNPHRHSMALFSSIFYILNPFAMVYVWNMLSITINVAYAIIPLVLALFMKGLNDKKFAYAFCSALVLPLFPSWTVVLPVLVPFLLLIYLLFYGVVNHQKSEITFAVKFFGLFAILFFLLNLWLILPLMYNIYGEWWGFSTSDFTRYYLSGYPIQDVIRLNFFFFSNGMIWPFYKSAIGEILGCIIPLTVFSALIVGRLVAFKKREEGFIIIINSLKKSNSTLHYFAFLAVLGIFLGTFAITPLKDAVVAILEKLPLSPVIFNNMVGEKGILLAAVGYSALFGFTLSAVYFRIITSPKPVSIRLKRIVAALLVGSILLATCVVYVWPMWTGDVFTHPLLPEKEKLGYINVPGYYYDAANWISNQKGEFRILSLPFVEMGITYTWEPYGYSGSTTDYFMFPKPVIIESTGSKSNDLISTIHQFLRTSQTSDVWKLLSLLNVKYIMVREDINYTHRGTDNPKDIERQLTSAFVPYLNIQNITNMDGEPVTSSLLGWRTIWGGAQYNLSLITGTVTYIDFTGFTSTDQGYFALAYAPEEPVNLSDATWLDISFMSSLPGKILVIIGGAEGEMFFDGRSSVFYTIGSNQVNKWVNLTLPLANPTSTTAHKPSLGSVRYITIALVDQPHNIPANLKVRRLMLDKGAEVPIQGINFERCFGKLLFYNVSSWLERIYASTNPVLVSNSFEVINRVKSQPDVLGNEVFIDSNVSETAILENLENESAFPPNITFERIDPSKWVVQVRNASNPFILTFNEAYDRHWKAYYGNTDWPNSLSSEPIPDKYHYKANAYANAWYINKTGTYTITLYFWPQSLLYLSATVTAITFVISVVFIAYKPMKSLLSKHKRTKNARLDDQNKSKLIEDKEQ